MAITLQTAEAHLDLWLKANEAVASGQSYSIGNRTLTRADVNHIRNEINYWSRTVNNIRAELNGHTCNAGVKVAVWR